MPNKVALPGLAQASPSGNGSLYPTSHSSGGSAGQASPSGYPPPSPSGKTPQAGGQGYGADHHSLSHEEVCVKQSSIVMVVIEVLFNIINYIQMLQNVPINEIVY